MKVNCEEIEINGVKYVKKGTVLPEVNKDYVIVRAQHAGCFFGIIVDRKGKEVLMKDARRLWFWSGAATLSQMAMEGVKNPTECKFPTPVTEIFISDVIEIIPCTEKAITSIKRVPIWAA